MYFCWPEMDMCISGGHKLAYEKCLTARHPFLAAINAFMVPWNAHLGNFWPPELHVWLPEMPSSWPEMPIWVISGDQKSMYGHHKCISVGQKWICVFLVARNWPMSNFWPPEIHFWPPEMHFWCSEMHILVISGPQNYISGRQKCFPAGQRCPYG